MHVARPHDAFTRGGLQLNEAFPAALGKKLLFGHRTVHATKPSDMSPGRRSKPVAGYRRNDAERSFRHMDPKVLHRCSKSAVVCTLRRAVTVRCPPCQVPAPCEQQLSWPEPCGSHSCTPFRVLPVLCHLCIHEMRSDLQIFRLFTRELWRVAIGVSQ